MRGTSVAPPTSSPPAAAPVVQAPGARSTRRSDRGESRTAWLLMTPAMLILVAMTIASALYIVWISFHRTDPFSGDLAFVGLDNFSLAFTTYSFLPDLARTLLFVVAAVALEMVLGIALGMLLARPVRGNKWAAGLFVIPFAATPAATALVTRALLDPNNGWVDYYLSKIGLMPDPVQWLSHPFTAWVSLTVLDVWQWTPFVALIVMSGMQSLPTDVNEAAAVDGASSFQLLRHITLPMLAPFIAIAGVLRVIQAFKTFDIFKILTNGGPGNSTEITNLSLYRIVLQDFNYGTGSAIAIMLLVVLLLLTPLLLKTVGKYADAEEEDVA